MPDHEIIREEHFGSDNMNFSFKLYYCYLAQTTEGYEQNNPKEVMEKQRFVWPPTAISATLNQFEARRLTVLELIRSRIGVQTHIL
jgi:hypothetical protein